MHVGGSAKIPEMRELARQVRLAEQDTEKYDAPVTCTNCGVSGLVRVDKGTTIKDAITEGLKCPYCDCTKLKTKTDSWKSKEGV